MKGKIPAALITLILVLTTTPVTLAQSNNSPDPATNINAQDWQDLRDLEPGKKILVDLKNGSTVDGEFEGVTGSKLSLSHNGDRYNLEQQEIQRVYP